MSRLQDAIDKELRRRNLIKLRRHPYTYKQIGLMYGVSDTMIYYWLYGGKSTKAMRIASLYFRPQPLDGKCEVCGKFPELPRPNLQHYHWDHDMPRVGIWVCNWCSAIIDYLDKKPESVKKYYDLKRSIMRNYERHMKDKEFKYG